MRIALFQPDIAGNVGTVLRTGACMGVGVDLIEPMGFAFGDRALARAGMDYTDRAQMTRHPDWDSFVAASAGRIVLMTTRGDTRLDLAEFRADDILLFGAEGAGVPDFVHARADCRLRIPMRAGLRSLNIAVSVAMTLAVALDRVDGWPD